MLTAYRTCKKTSKNLDFPGKPLSGRFVIVQMDNGEDVPLNLKEVRVYGQVGRRLKGSQLAITQHLQCGHQVVAKRLARCQ